MAFYINFYFKNIEYDDGFYGGTFLAPDNDISFEFLYDRETKKFVDIWNNNKPIEEILPIPIGWLDRRLAEKGFLNKNESKISF